MKITFLETEYNVKNDYKEVNSLLYKISAEAIDQKLVVSHVNVDGEEIYTPMETLVDTIDLDSAHSINIIAFTKREYEINIMNEGYQYILRALPEIEKLIVSFYNGGLSEDWIKFRDFIEGLQWLIQLTESGIANDFFNEEMLIRIEAELKEQPAKLLDCLESADTIMLADIMSYEVVPVLKMLAEQLSFIVENGVNIEQ